MEGKACTTNIMLSQRYHFTDIVDTQNVTYTYQDLLYTLSRYCYCNIIPTFKNPFVSAPRHQYHIRDVVGGRGCRDRGRYHRGHRQSARGH